MRCGCRILSVLVLPAMISYADGTSVYAGAGLTDDIYYALCGVWLRVEERDARTQETAFSWGKARYVVNGSLDIDLGAAPPFLTFPGALFEIREVGLTGDGKYTLKMLWKRSRVPDTPIDLVVHLSEDGTMWWEPNGIMGQGESVRYCRIDGPKRPVK